MAEQQDSGGLPCPLERCRAVLSLPTARLAAHVELDPSGAATSQQKPQLAHAGLRQLCPVSFVLLLIVVIFFTFICILLSQLQTVVTA